jgi:hypothetical protein
MKTFKLWVTIEEITTDEDGDETYRDMTEEDTCSVGTFNKIENAREQMSILVKNYGYDNDKTFE